MEGQTINNFLCQFCKHANWFKSRKTLGNHLRKYHPEDQDIDQIKKRDAKITCGTCMKTFSTPQNKRVHEQSCRSKLETSLVKLAGNDGDAPHFTTLAQNFYGPSRKSEYNDGDGSQDISDWRQRPIESHGAPREPVIIEGDIRCINWDHVAEIQHIKYHQGFNVIYMDPPWSCNLDLDYPVLKDSIIFNIPFHKL